MKPLRLALLVAVLSVAALPAPIGAQGVEGQSPAPPPTATPAAPAASDAPSPAAGSRTVNGTSGEVFRLGQDYTLRAGDTAARVVVIMGNVRIEGHVTEDVVNILGTLTITGTGTVDKDVVSIAGGARVGDGASIGNDFVVVGGGADTPAGFSPGGEQIVVGPGPLGVNLEWLGPWLTRGLLWGRPIVPGLGWMWPLIGLVFLLHLAINQIADTPVRGVTGALVQKPLTAFGAGLLVLLLIGPVTLLLAISVVGLLVIPFVGCAVLVAAIIGKVGVMRWLGMLLLRDEAAGTATRAFIAFTAGFVVLLITYMVPIAGFAAWAVFTVLGLGAAALAFMNAYKRERPPVAPMAVVPPPVPARYGLNAYQYSATVPADAAAGTATPDAPATTPPVRMLPLFARAEFRDRLAAFVLDVFLVVVLVNMLNRTDPSAFVLPGLFVYHVGFWTWKQTTVGGMVAHLRLVRLDGTPLTLGDAFVRALGAVFSGLAIGIGFLWILRDPDRQAWHDKIAGTYVVKVPRNYPL